MSDSNAAQNSAPQIQQATATTGSVDIDPAAVGGLPGAEAADQRDWLLQIAREMAGVHDLDRLLQMVVDAALCVAPSAAKCVIHLLSPDHSRLVPRVCSTPAAVLAEQAGIPADRGVAGRALRERRMVYVADTRTSPDYLPLNSGPEIRALLVDALHVGDHLLGTLSLSSQQENAFSAAERQWVHTLAAQAAVAIEQTRLMAAALTERERSDAVLFSISEGLAVLDAQGRVVRINPAICQMLQLATDDADLPCDPAEIGAVAQLLNPSKGEIVGPYEMEIEIGHRRATVRANVSPVESPAGGRVLVVRDTTQERQAAEARSLFISQVAHELRTPLQHILSFLSLAGDTAEQDEELAHLLSHIEGETHHLARLVDDLTELSRLEAGRFAVHLERVRMDVWVRQATARLAPRAQMREHLLLLDELPEPVWCLTDPLRVEQVLTNLVENALKYVPTASTVRVRLECAPDSAIVRVIDQGPGIAPEELDSIFGAFYQIDKQASLRSGMGLGLYISREIVRALHGDIWVESQVGLGSAFSFRLPRLPGPAESSA